MNHASAATCFDKPEQGVQGACSSILAVTSEPPWPLDSGGHIRSYHLLRALARRFRVRLVVPVAPEQRSGVEALQEIGVDVCGVAVPARSTRREVFRAIAALAHGEPYVLYRRHDHQSVRAAIRQKIDQESPDLIYLDHLDSLVYHRVFPLEVPRVLDLHNVYSSMVERIAQEQKYPWKRAYLRREARLLARVERRAVRESAVLLTVSEEDRNHVAGLGPSSVHVVPNGVDCGRYAALVGRPRVGPPVLVYIGSMNWAPNVRAAISLAREILPRVRHRHPQAKVRIIGRDPTPEVLALAEIEGVEVTGAVADVRDHLADARALVVPLESGGGTRLKILEAFAAGLPVVSTPIGCEGLSAEPGRHILVAERGELADAVSDLIDDTGLANRIAKQAHALVVAYYDWKGIGLTACELIEHALQCETASNWARKDLQC